jgi:CubicO group peptidase (beta-lactamase class C family)
MVCHGALDSAFLNSTHQSADRTYDLFMRCASLVLLLPLLLAPPASTGAASTDADLRAALERRVPDLLHDGDVPGLSIAVIRDGTLFWSGAFGVADPATGAPVGAETVFQAASLSKPVFAYIALRLVDRGALGLDTPLVTYLPDERFADDRASRITARMVLSHTTGLPNWGDDKLKLAFPPGERFSYSGEGYFYLQKVVEKITGTPLAELARREVFVPFGMTRTSYVWPGGPAAIGVNDYGNIEPTDPKLKANAAASLLTTGGDYARFLLAVLAGRGLKAETAAAMLSPQVRVPAKFSDPFSPPRDDISWGLGWGLEKTADGETFWHWGHQDAWRAFVAVRRDGRAGLVFFANSANGLSIARALADLAGVGGLHGFDWLDYESFDNPRRLARRELLKTFVDQGAATGMRRFAQMRSASPGIVDAKLADDLADLLLGSGKNAEAATLLQQRAADSPSAETHGNAGDAWLAAGELERALRSYETAAKLDPKNPRAAEIRWIHEMQRARESPAALSAAALQRFAGDYGLRHVQLEGGHLIYHNERRPITYRLIPLSEDTFLVAGNGSVEIRFAAAPGGRVAKLVILGPAGPQEESPRDP